jgi:prevent-host-death family protein
MEIPMIQAQNIRSLSDFRQNASAHLDRLAKTGGVDVLTVNGEARGVVMSPAEFDRLSELARQVEISQELKRAMEGVEAGRTRPAKQAIREIADELGLKLDR